MEIAQTPDTYLPKMDLETKTYTDQYIFDYSRGIQCPCTTTKIFYKRESFQNHWKCNRHKNWIKFLNENAVNFYQKTIEQEKIIKMQKTMLVELDNQLKQRDVIISYLESTKQKQAHVEERDLLDFD